MLEKLGHLGKRRAGDKIMEADVGEGGWRIPPNPLWLASQPARRGERNTERERLPFLSACVFASLEMQTTRLVLMNISPCAVGRKVGYSFPCSIISAIAREQTWIVQRSVKCEARGLWFKEALLSPHFLVLQPLKCSIRFPTRNSASSESQFSFLFLSTNC